MDELDELSRHTKGVVPYYYGWRFYVWAIPTTVGAVFLTWLTFRNGIWFLVAYPAPFLLWLIYMMLLVSLWRNRPRKKKPDQSIRLNLE